MRLTKTTHVSGTAVFAFVLLLGTGCASHLVRPVEDVSDVEEGENALVAFSVASSAPVELQQIELLVGGEMPEGPLPGPSSFVAFGHEPSLGCMHSAGRRSDSEPLTYDMGHFGRQVFTRVLKQVPNPVEIEAAIGNKDGRLLVLEYRFLLAIFDGHVSEP